MLTFDDLLEASDSLLDRNVLALHTGELLRNAERLGEETLDLTRSCDCELIVVVEFVHTEDRNDILEFIVTLESSLYRASYLVMLIADDLGG